MTCMSKSQCFLQIFATGQFSHILIPESLRNKHTINCISTVVKTVIHLIMTGFTSVLTATVILLQTISRCGGNTLASHLFKPRTLWVESWWLLTNGRQFTVQDLDQLYVLVYPAHKTTCRDIIYTVLKVPLKPV